MGFNVPIRFKAEPLRSVVAAVITGVYLGVGPALAHPCRQFKIDNLTDALLIFSFDGINDHFVVPPNGFFLDDITSNKTLSQGFFLAIGDRLYVKGATEPTTGAIFFSVFYGFEGN